MPLKLLKLSFTAKALMLEKIFRDASYVVVALALTFSILLAGLISVDAATPGFTPPENYRKDDSQGMVVEPSQDNQKQEVSKDEMGMEDIFGSEQVFPFEMGLGNSAF